MIRISLPSLRMLFSTTILLSDLKKDRQRPTLLSVNRFEKKKNVKLAIKAFANLKRKLGDSSSAAVHDLRLVLAGNYFPHT